MDVLVLQHIACEPPGVYEDVLHERGANLDRVEVDAGDELPDWREFSAIVAMGGPMSANDDADLLWLRAEKELIAEAVHESTPFWGSASACSCWRRASAPASTQERNRRSASCRSS